MTENPSNRSKKIRKGDKVIVIAGNERGKTGTVLSCTAERILIQGINMRKKHVKPTQQNQKGGVISMEKPIHISNVKPCDEAGQPIKLKVQIDDKGNRELVHRVDGKDILYRSLKKS